MKKHEYTEASRKALSEAGKKHRRPVSTPDGDFDSIKAAAARYEISQTAMAHRCNSVNWREFTFEEKNNE